MTVRYAVGLPNVGEFADARLLAELAVAAEESGWDGVYLWDHLIPREPGWPAVNPVVAAAAMAAATSRVRLLVMWVLPRRRAQVVAREAVSLDRLSAGRLTLVTAIGATELEYAGFGEPADARQRGVALDAALTDLIALWRGEPVRVAGGGVPVQMVPGPVQQPRIPIWCGGRWPHRAPLRRAARFDGALPVFVDQRVRVVPPAEFGAAVSFLEERRGGLDGFDIAMEGASEAAGAALAAAPYVDAGLTWWIESTGWWRGGVAAARARILAGP